MPSPDRTSLFWLDGTVATGLAVYLLAALAVDRCGLKDGPGTRWTSLRLHARSSFGRETWWNYKHRPCLSAQARCLVDALLSNYRKLVVFSPMRKADVLLPVYMFYVQFGATEGYLTSRIVAGERNSTVPKAFVMQSIPSTEALGNRQRG